MAIFEKQARLKKGSRSNTKLIVSGGMSPAEHFILDKDLMAEGKGFTYEYGGPGQKDVALGKGLLVGVKPEAEVDYETGSTKTVVTLAGKDDAKVIGMAPYNFAKHTDDFLDGNRPAIITREYVEVPYFNEQPKAAKHNYGAAYGPLKIGDQVTYSRNEDNLGQIIKYDPEANHKPEEIVGRVLALEFDAEVQGWLKWLMFDEAAKNEDYGVDKTGYEAPGRGGFPFDADYRDGTQDIDGYYSQYTTNPTGAPGLFDGLARAETPRQEKFTLNHLNKVVEMKDTNITEGSVELTGLTLTEKEASDLDVNEAAIDYQTGQLFYNLAEDTPVTVDYKANTYGTPPHLDFDGVLGAARILLNI